MSQGPDFGNSSRFPSMLASRADREATQATLETAFADERLTQDEFESRVGRALSAHTLADLAELTRDLPGAPDLTPPRQPAVYGPPASYGPSASYAPARRPGRRVWWLVAGLAVVVVAVLMALVAVVSTGTTQQTSQSAAAPQAAGSAPAATASSGAARCPVGTSATAVAIANALATNPLYVGTSAKQVSAGQARRIRARIASADPGRIRVAAVTASILRHGGGARALANSISDCRADTAGTVLVASTRKAFLVTSYADYRSAAAAVEAALNTHASLGGGLLDAVGRLATVDPGH
jgi:hypothetical protein